MTQQGKPDHRRGAFDRVRIAIRLFEQLKRDWICMELGDAARDVRQISFRLRDETQYDFSVHIPTHRLLPSSLRKQVLRPSHFPFLIFHLSLWSEPLRKMRNEK